MFGSGHCPAILLGMGANLEPCGRLTVAKLIYSTIMSLDGYVADKYGDFDYPPFRALR